MHLLGFVLDLDGLGAATATIVVGVTAVAELKSLDGLAAVVKRGEGQLIIVDKNNSLVLSRVYRDTPISHWLLEVPDRSLNICRSCHHGSSSGS